MKAVLLKKSGSLDRLLLAEVPKPAPEADELLVKVHAVMVTRGDKEARKIRFTNKKQAASEPAACPIALSNL